MKVLGEWKKVKAQIEQINAFSAHADYQETVEWLKEVDTSRLKKIFLVHGEKAAQKNLTKVLNENGYNDVEVISYGKTYILD